VTEYTKIASLPWYGFIALALAICITIQVRRRKLEPLPKPIENAIQAIEVGVKTGKLPPAHATMQYNRVIDTMISELDLKEEYKRQAEELRKMVFKEGEPAKSLSVPSEKAQD